MKISSIEIENFKLFKNSRFEFDKNFNLLIGINGSGKTSLLRAIAVALGGWANAYVKHDKNLRAIRDEEIREIQNDKRFDKTKKTTIKTKGNSNIVDRLGVEKNGYCEWTRTRKLEEEQTLTSGNIQYDSYPTAYNLNFNTLGSDILSYIEEGNNFNLPIIAFYECDRLWLAKNRLNIEMTAKAQYSRFDPYVDCFHTGADHNAIGEWLLKHELASIQKKQDTPLLKTIKKAAIGALENCIGISFDMEEGRVVVDFDNEISIPFEHLSDGQRTILGLFCDIARRVAILNPHLEENTNEMTEGIVLIDELDLHLHPKWQMKIIEDLRKVFPKIQFICTTHSPILLRSVEKEKIILLENGEQKANKLFSKGRDINSILYDFMGVSERTKEYEEKIENLFGFLDDENKNEAQKIFDELKKDYGERDSTIAEAEILLQMLNNETDK